MSIYNFRRMRTVAAGVVTALVVLCGAGLAQPSNHIVISQVYGGGGNSGATFTNDFVELFNPTAAPVTVAGWSVQYASSTGTLVAGDELPTLTLQPGQYLLVQESQGAGGTTNLPTPDASGSYRDERDGGKDCAGEQHDNVERLVPDGDPRGGPCGFWHGGELLAGTPTRDLVEHDGGDPHERVLADEQQRGGLSARAP